MEKEQQVHTEAEMENEVTENQSNNPEHEEISAQADNNTTSSIGDAELQQEISKMQQLVDESQQRVLRTQADFDNYRKRTQKEKEEFAKYASSKLITELLPVLDNFDRALTTATDNPEFESFTKGIQMIFRQLDGVLKAEGLVAMEAVGEPFNPEFHQAVMQVESEEHEEGIVVEELQKGYMLKDKVLRPAMVKVSV